MACDHHHQSIEEDETSSPYAGILHHMLVFFTYQSELSFVFESQEIFHSNLSGSPHRCSSLAHSGSKAVA
jgi:hypothetical protein